MSNRLENDERIPFITDIALAEGVARMIAETSAQADTLRSFGSSLTDALRSLPWTLSELFDLARDAEMRRDVCVPEFPGTCFVTNRTPEPSLRVRLIGHD